MNLRRSMQSCLICTSRISKLCREYFWRANNWLIETTRNHQFTITILPLQVLSLGAKHSKIVSLNHSKKSTAWAKVSLREKSTKMLRNSIKIYLRSSKTTSNQRLDFGRRKLTRALTRNSNISLFHMIRAARIKRMDCWRSTSILFWSDCYVRLNIWSNSTKVCLRLLLNYSKRLISTEGKLFHLSWLSKITTESWHV